MSISRRSLIAGATAGGALLALNAPAANARNRFVAATVEPTIKKVATPAVGHAIKRGNSTTSLSAINSITVSPVEQHCHSPVMVTITQWRHLRH